MVDIAAGGSLGSITEFASGRPTLGDFVGFAGKKAAVFRLQAIARDITPDERVKICWRHRLPDTPTLTLVHIPSRGVHHPARGHVRGLMHCCSVWVCAVCSGRISQRRKSDLLQAVNDNRARLLPVHVTYTARHNVKTKLAEQISAMNEAYRWYRAGRYWQGVKEVFGVRASVRALEITHGSAGWHAHFHELLFVEVGPGFLGETGLEKFGGELFAALSRRWLESLARFGLNATKENGLIITTHAGDVGAYLAKYGHLPTADNGWTVAHELTLQQVKKAGGAGGRVPWEILWDAQWDKKSAALWREYVAATKGRSQLQWSRGAKEVLGVDMKTDDEILDADENGEVEILAHITAEQWRFIDERGLIPHLVGAAETKNLEYIEGVLDAANKAIYNNVLTVQCLPCSVDADRQVFYDDRGENMICPGCGRVKEKGKI